jgi:hypothetical protein
MAPVFVSLDLLEIAWPKTKSVPVLGYASRSTTPVTRDRLEIVWRKSAAPQGAIDPRGTDGVGWREED